MSLQDGLINFIRVPKPGDELTRFRREKTSTDSYVNQHCLWEKIAPARAATAHGTVADAFLRRPLLRQPEQK